MVKPRLRFIHNEVIQMNVLIPLMMNCYIIFAHCSNSMFDNWS